MKRDKVSRQDFFKPRSSHKPSQTKQNLQENQPQEKKQRHKIELPVPPRHDIEDFLFVPSSKLQSRYVDDLTNITVFKEFFHISAMNGMMSICVKKDDDEAARFTLLSFILYHIVVVKTNTPLFKDVINKFEKEATAMKYTLFEVEYILVSLFETCLMLDLQNRLKRNDFWRECAEYSRKRILIIYNSYINLLLQKVSLQPSKEHIDKLIRNIREVDMPDRIANVFLEGVFFAYDIQLYRKYVDKSLLTSATGASLIDNLGYLADYLNRMKLCGELGKLLTIGDKQQLVNEELRLAMFPHIPVCDIKKILITYVMSKSHCGFTMTTVDDICRQIEKQKIIHYPFEPPYIHGDELSDMFKKCQLTKIPKYSFEGTPFQDKVYLN